MRHYSSDALFNMGHLRKKTIVNFKTIFLKIKFYVQHKSLTISIQYAQQVIPVVHLSIYGKTNNMILIEKLNFI